MKEIKMAKTCMAEMDGRFKGNSSLQCVHKNQKFIQKKVRAFTLAEVLVTLTIIGVVAAMTVPTLMENYEKIQFQSGFKKAYSEVNQAIKLMVNDEGENLDYKYFLYEFKGYFKKLEDYGDMAIGNVKKNFKTYKSFKNDHTITANFYDDYLFTLSDGVDVFINADNYKPPVQLMVDTNGNKKGPNRLGYDFLF